jgi:hypothetical protein
MTKDQLRRELHKLNPFAGYLGSYGATLTKEALERALQQYKNA